MLKDVYNLKQELERDDFADDDAMMWCWQGYFHSLAAEVFQHNISVTLVCPGPVYSNVLAVAYTDKVGEVRHDAYMRTSWIKKGHHTLVYIFAK